LSASCWHPFSVFVVPLLIYVLKTPTKIAAASSTFIVCFSSLTGFRECRELIDEYLSDDGPDIRINVCRVMAFNYLIGNYDAHGKNFSIIHDKQLRFAPFYDLLSTQVYPALTSRFAMAIGDTYQLERIKIHSLEKFAKTMNFRFSFLNEILEETLTAVGYQLTPLLGEHEKQYGKSIVYDELYEKIQKNMRSMKKIQESRRISG